MAILSNALANNEGLAQVTDIGSNLNIDGETKETLGLANGVGLEALTAGDTAFDPHGGGRGIHINRINRQKKE